MRYANRGSAVAPRAALHCDRAVASVQELDPDLGAALQVEHVCLESEQPVVTATRPRSARGHGPLFRFESRWRGCETELAFTADGRLTVRSRDRGKPLRRYAIDLRFVDAAGSSMRRIAWQWWLATTALAVAGAMPFWTDLQFLGPGWHAFDLQVSVALLTAAACVGLLGLYHTRDTLELRSLHGGARLAVVTGNLGSARRMREFAAELTRRVAEARQQSPQSKRHFLRDEMREHHRLRSEGVFAAPAYEASKRRILAAHD